MMEQMDIKKKVLIVDDEPNVRRLLHTILSKTFEVFEAEDGDRPSKWQPLKNRMSF